MTDADVGIVMGSFFLGAILWFIKAWIHFDYLKQEEGKFKDVDSLTYLLFRPIYVFAHLPEMFIILNVPVLWRFNTRRRLQIGLLSYSAILLCVFAILYENYCAL